MDKEKTLLFSVTAKDCDFTYTKGSGSGGQKKNKTSSAVYCKHRESGAQGYSDGTRSQRTNKCMAFKRMAETKKFKNWHMMECARFTGKEVEMKERVDRAMHPKNMKTEIKNEKGKWVEVDELPSKT